MRVAVLHDRGHALKEDAVGPLYLCEPRLHERLLLIVAVPSRSLVDDDLTLGMQAALGPFLEAGLGPSEAAVMVVVHELVPFFLEELVLNGQDSVHYMKLYSSL